MSKWNYRVFRCVDQDGSSYYEMREAHYDEAGNITGWTEGASSPFGETLDELVSDFAWFVASLNKPVLDDKTGTECEPAKMLADDLEAWVAAHTPAGPDEVEEQVLREAEPVQPSPHPVEKRT